LHSRKRRVRIETEIDIQLTACTSICRLKVEIERLDVYKVAVCILASRGKLLLADLPVWMFDFTARFPFLGLEKL
jgi:hypothetical protein